MKISFEQIIAVLPILIIGLTIIIVMLNISYKRNHIINVNITISGLILAFLSLIFTFNNSAHNIFFLIQTDNFSKFYSELILVSSIVTSVFSYTWLKNNNYDNYCDEFYLMLLISAIGGLFLTNVNHFSSLFLGFELLSLPIFGMIGYVNRYKFSLEASIKYMLLSSVASAFLLFGIAMIYSCIGQLSFFSVNQNLDIIKLNYSVFMIGISMILFALSFKLSLVPFHLWTPDIYQGTPTPILIFFSTVSKISIFLAMVRLFSILNIEVINTSLKYVLITISFLSILFGNIMAFTQVNIKRMLGYSSITHLGYLLIGLITINTKHTLALESINIYLINYFIINIGIFGVLTILSRYFMTDVENSNVISSYQGLFWKKPILASILTSMLLSLSGIPITLGFIGKLYIIILSIENQFWWIICAILISSIIGLLFCLRIIVSLYLSIPKKSNMHFPIKQTISYEEIILLMTTFPIFIFGIYPTWLINFIKFINF